MLSRAFFVSLCLAPALRAEGKALPGPGLVACGDVDHDGVTDLLVASRDQRQPEAVWLISGAKGNVLGVYCGSSKEAGFGSVVSALPDLDGDGLPEVAVASSAYRTYVENWTQVGGRYQPGYGLWFAGKPHTELLSSRDQQSLLSLGCEARVLPYEDANGDGKPDLLVFQRRGLSKDAETLTIRSGTDAKILRQLEPAAGQVHLDVAVVGDVDGDGRSDLVVATGAGPDLEPESPIALAALSGKDGHEIWRDQGIPSHGAHWITIKVAPDQDGDGVAEIIAGEEARWARLLSGRSGALLWMVDGLGAAAIHDSYPTCLDVLGDVDGDGVADFVVVGNDKPVGGGQTGIVALVSGKTHAWFRELVHSPGHRFGVCAVGDVDGDKLPDVALVDENHEQRWTEKFDPTVRVISSKDGSTLWEKDTPALRAWKSKLKATPESAPLKPGEKRPEPKKPAGRK